MGQLYAYDVVCFDSKPIPAPEPSPDPIDESVAEILENPTDSFPLGERPLLASVYFEHNSRELLPSAQDALRQVAETMRARPALRIAIEGHCAKTSNKESKQRAGMKVSIERAEHAAEYLLQAGVSAQRMMRPIGHGIDRPIASNADKLARRENRRVVIAVVEDEDGPIFPAYTKPHGADALPAGSRSKTVTEEVELYTEMVKANTLNGLRESDGTGIYGLKNSRIGKKRRNRTYKPKKTMVYDISTGNLVEAPFKRIMSNRMWADVFMGDFPIDTKKALVKCTRNNMKEAFSENDKNHDDRVSQKEFKATLKKLKVPMESSVFENLMATQDPYGRNIIDYREFMQACVDYKGWLGSIKALLLSVKHMGRYDRTLYSHPLRSVTDIFHAMDKDKGGSVSLGEFREGLKRMDIGLAPQAIEDLLTVFDLDGNGEIDEAEFTATVDLFGPEADEVFTRQKHVREERLLTTTHKQRLEINPLTHPVGYCTSTVGPDPGAVPQKMTGEMKRHLALQNRLSEAYSNVQEVDLQKRMLCAAVEEGRLAEVKRLVLEVGMDPSTELTRGSTLLHLACYHGQFNVAKFLALSGADIWQLDLEGNLPAALLVNEKHRNEMYQLANYILQGDDGDLTGGGPPSRKSPAMNVSLSRQMRQNETPVNLGGIGSAGGLNLAKASGGLGSTQESGSNLSIRKWKDVVKYWSPTVKRTLFGYTGRALEKMFTELDTDRDGLVSTAEFHTALYRLRVELETGQVEACVRALQVDDKPGFVDYVGFAMTISKYKCWILSVKQVMDNLKNERRLFGQSLKDMLTTFRTMDTNGDGELDEKEFTWGMQQLDLRLSQKQMQEMMSAFDLDGNGRIDVEEFVEALRAYKEAGKA